MEPVCLAARDAMIHRNCLFLAVSVNAVSGCLDDLREPDSSKSLILRGFAGKVGSGRAIVASLTVTRTPRASDSVYRWAVCSRESDKLAVAGKKLVRCPFPRTVGSWPSM